MITRSQTRKPKRGPALAAKVGAQHDVYERALDGFRRKLLPSLDLDNTADAQIAELAEDIVTCLRMLRIELGGYDPEGGRE